MMRILTLAVIATQLAACDTDTSSSEAGPEVVVDSIGDTIIVRTLTGSVWDAEATLVPEVSIGELDGPEEYLFGNVESIAVDDDRNTYVLDGQAQHVRMFDSAGVCLEPLGRRGEGPGEFDLADAVAVLSDGRVAVRDASRFRIQLFAPFSRDAEEWTYGAVTITHRAGPLWNDGGGRVFLLTSNPLRERGDPFLHIIVIGPDGAHLDTLPEPSVDYERPSLMAQRAIEGGGTMSMSDYLPFTPEFFWAVHATGHFLTRFPTSTASTWAATRASCGSSAMSDEFPCRVRSATTTENASCDACGPLTRAGAGTGPRFRSTSPSSTTCTPLRTDGTGCSWRPRGDRLTT